MNINTRPGASNASAEALAFAFILMARFQKAFAEWESMEQMHAAMAVNATHAMLEHTGGNVWVSQSLHVADDGTTLLVIAGDDSIEVCFASHPDDLKASAGTRWDECGEWTETVILEAYA